MLAATVALVCVARAGCGPAALAVRRGDPGRRVGGGAALVDGVGDGGSLSTSHTAATAGRRARSRRAPSPAWARSAAWPASAESGMAKPYPLRGQRFSRCRRPWCCWGSWRPGCRRWCAARRRVPLLALGGGGGAGAGRAGHRSGPTPLRAMVRRRARARRAARRAEVGGAGDARIYVGGRRRGGDAAPVAAAGSDGAGLLPGADLRAARPGLGRGRARCRPVHYPPGGRRCRGDDQRRPAALSRSCPPDTMRRFAWSGAAPVLDPLPRWVRADVLAHRRPGHLGGRPFPARAPRPGECSSCCWPGPILRPLAAGRRRAGGRRNRDAAGDMGAAARTADALHAALPRTTTSRCTGSAATPPARLPAGRARRR